MPTMPTNNFEYTKLMVAASQRQIQQSQKEKAVTQPLPPKPPPPAPVQPTQASGTAEAYAKVIGINLPKPTPMPTPKPTSSYNFLGLPGFNPNYPIKYPTPETTPAIPKTSIIPEIQIPADTKPDQSGGDIATINGVQYFLPNALGYKMGFRTMDEYQLAENLRLTYGTHGGSEVPENIAIIHYTTGGADTWIAAPLPGTEGGVQFNAGATMTQEYIDWFNKYVADIPESEWNDWQRKLTEEYNKTNSYESAIAKYGKEYNSWLNSKITEGKGIWMPVKAYDGDRLLTSNQYDTLCNLKGESQFEYSKGLGIIPEDAVYQVGKKEGEWSYLPKDLVEEKQRIENNRGITVKVKQQDEAIDKLKAGGYQNKGEISTIYGNIPQQPTYNIRKYMKDNPNGAKDLLDANFSQEQINQAVAANRIYDNAESALKSYKRKSVFWTAYTGKVDSESYTQAGLTKYLVDHPGDVTTLAIVGFSGENIKKASDNANSVLKAMNYINEAAYQKYGTGKITGSEAGALDRAVVDAGLKLKGGSGIVTWRTMSDDNKKLVAAYWATDKYKSNPLSETYAAFGHLSQDNAALGLVFAPITTILKPGANLLIGEKVSGWDYANAAAMLALMTVGLRALPVGAIGSKIVTGGAGTLFATQHAMSWNTMSNSERAIAFSFDLLLFGATLPRGIQTKAGRLAGRIIRDEAGGPLKPVQVIDTLESQGVKMTPVQKSQLNGALEGVVRAIRNNDADALEVAAKRLGEVADELPHTGDASALTLKNESMMMRADPNYYLELAKEAKQKATVGNLAENIKLIESIKAESRARVGVKEPVKLTKYQLKKQQAERQFEIFGKPKEEASLFAKIKKVTDNPSVKKTGGEFEKTEFKSTKGEVESVSGKRIATTPAEIQFQKLVKAGKIPLSPYGGEEGMMPGRYTVAEAAKTRINAIMNRVKEHGFKSAIDTFGAKQVKLIYPKLTKATINSETKLFNIKAKQLAPMRRRVLEKTSKYIYEDLIGSTRGGRDWNNLIKKGLLAEPKITGEELVAWDKFQTEPPPGLVLDLARTRPIIQVAEGGEWKIIPRETAGKIKKPVYLNDAHAKIMLLQVLSGRSWVSGEGAEIQSEKVKGEATAVPHKMPEYRVKIARKEIGGEYRYYPEIEMPKITNEYPSKEVKSNIKWHIVTDKEGNEYYQGIQNRIIPLNGQDINEQSENLANAIQEVADKKGMTQAAKEYGEGLVLAVYPYAFEYIIAENQDYQPGTGRIEFKPVILTPDKPMSPALERELFGKGVRTATVLVKSGGTAEETYNRTMTPEQAAKQRGAEQLTEVVSTKIREATKGKGEGKAVPSIRPGIAPSKSPSRKPSPIITPGKQPKTIQKPAPAPNQKPSPKYNPDPAVNLAPIPYPIPEPTPEPAPTPAREPLPEPQPLPEPIPEPIPEPVPQPIKKIPPPIKLPGGKSDGEKRRIIAESNGALAWRMGQIGGKDRWDTVINPYQSNAQYLMVLGSPPKGATIIKRGEGSARATAQMLRGQPPKKSFMVDSGFTDINVKPSGRKIDVTFTPDPDDRTRGDITIGNVTPRISPRTPRITPKQPRLR